jgi:hypothetical protein
MLTLRAFAPALWLFVGSAAVLAQTPATPASPAPAQGAPAVCALGFQSQEAALEEFLRTAEVAKREQIPVGVTRPTRAYFQPGGLAASMAWKPIRPGVYDGYFESYKSEIAAYELNKLLDLHMKPPTVERQVDGAYGAAVLWVSPTKSFKELGGVPGQKGVKAPPPAEARNWTRQVVRAKMFDNLIANRDPNLGNWLVDEDWHLILIDHSRAFTTMRNLVHAMDNIDRGLWQRFEALDEGTLQKAIGTLVGRSEVRAVIQRRNRMKEEIAKLVAARGESIFID